MARKMLLRALKLEKKNIFLCMDTNLINGK